MYNNLFLNINFVSTKLNFSNADIEKMETVLSSKYTQVTTTSDKRAIHFHTAPNNFFTIAPGNIQIAVPSFEDSDFSNLINSINEVNNYNGFDRLSVTQVSFEKIIEKNKNVTEIIQSKGLSNDFSSFITQFSPKGVGFRVPYAKENIEFEVYAEPLFSNLNNLFLRIVSGTSSFNSIDEINKSYEEIKNIIEKYNNFFTE